MQLHFFQSAIRSNIVWQFLVSNSKTNHVFLKLHSNLFIFKELFFNLEPPNGHPSLFVVPQTFIFKWKCTEFWKP